MIDVDHRLAKWRAERRETRPGRPSFVYFIGCEEAAAIKVGFSTEVQRRLSTLQSSCPFELTLLGTAPGGAEHEARIHWLFRGDHIRGEWFRDSGQLRTFIDAILRKPESERTAFIEREPSIPESFCSVERNQEASEEMERLLEVVAEEHGVMTACKLYLKAWLR